MHIRTTLAIWACIAIVFALSGCDSGERRLYLRGHSQNWEAIMDAVYTESLTQSSRNQIRESVKIRYAGKNAPPPEPVKFKFEWVPYGGTGAVTTTLRDGYFEFGGGGSGLLPPKNATVKVTIEWDGLTETLEVK